MKRNLSEEKEMRIESARIGAEMAFSFLGVKKDEISQREAFRLFGEAQVRKWVSQGSATQTKQKSNGRVLYSRIELNMLKSLEDQHYKNE